jgi:DNA-binding NarL/FixJ family response regulator
MPEMAALPVPEGSRRRLLLVSDDAGSAEALRSHLARHGFLVGVANSARSALKASKETHPEVVLVDAAIHHGWQPVIDALDGVVPRNRVAVLAAYWTTDGRQTAEAAGIGGILLKQLEGEALVSRLRELGDDVGSAGANVPLDAGIRGGAR